MKLFFALLALGVGVSLAEKVRFDNYTLYRLTPNNEESLSFLQELEEATDAPSEYNFWSSPVKVGAEVDIMVPPHRSRFFEAAAKSRQMDFQVVMDNVQEHIDREDIRQKFASERFGWTSYHTYEEYNEYLRTLVDRYPNTVTLLQGGTSYEGRQILGVRVSFSSSNLNRGVFLESLIHAREWITGAVTTYVLNELLTSTDPAVRRIAENHDWYVFPVFNPDGYVFTHTSNRMWRKTRVPYSGSCFGADPNRNWGHYWNSGGSSALPCSETYRGPRAFSEPSTRTMSEFITSISHRLVAYLSFHSYSQLLLIPYGYTAAYLDNYNVTYPLGLRAAQSLASRYGTQYTVGNIVEAIYVASGGSMDWVKGTYGTEIAYTYELRDTGRFGFILPAEQIIPTAVETLDSLVTILQYFQ
ncbi:hypothetical protein NQ315_006318 [Exocentrus adspersus]|uniref:Zinc carboxypeptidase A 1 n=1 Tax=Exocentrus adspersus TaxID=1586481 RepID=A0AAV8VZW2_9CUCU|nr:hypothetical protein NQ315_006318 [Exocentrus adspersus]